MNRDTIAAITTAMSNAGIGIIRISGDNALNIIDKIYRSKNGNKIISKQKSHTIHYGYIFDNNTVIDEVIILIMKAPNSYTVEDVIEINCHGGVVVMKKILELILKKGARCAEPGEFTKRAFLNGRIDLSQAEAVIDIINSKNDFALRSSINQLKGSILNKIKELRKIIITDIAFIEASLDDPEHIDLDDFSDRLLININKINDELNILLSSVDNGRLLKEGIKTVIIGKPNVGKSSLLNILVGEDRAIVTDIPGTTRDSLEETININGILLNIIDTAGIRNTEDIVEKIGVERSIKYIDNADLILYVVDASVNLDENDENIIKLIKDKKSIVLLNKSDLKMILSSESLESMIGKSVVNISAKENLGFERLYEVIKEMFFSGNLDFNNEVLITNIRHKESIIETIKSINQVKESIINQMPEDFYSIDLMNAYVELGKIIGESLEEDLIDKIFSEFCMGK